MTVTNVKLQGERGPAGEKGANGEVTKAELATALEPKASKAETAAAQIAAEAASIPLPGAGAARSFLKRNAAGKWVPVLDREVDPKDFGAVGNGVADDTIPIQEAIDAAQALIEAGTLASVVLFGKFKITAKLVLKSAPLKGDYALVGTEIIWGGAAGGLALEKNTTYQGGYSSDQISGIAFRPGEHLPASWLEIAPGTVNTLGALEFIFFGECSSDAIKVNRWTEINWHHLYWENPGGYAIRLSNNLSTASHTLFTLSDFAYGYATSGGGAPGFICVENPFGANLGKVSLKKGRIEIDAGAPWGGNQAVVNFIDASTNEHAMNFDFDTVGYIDGTSMAGSSLIFREGATPAMFAASIRSCELATLPKLWGGSLPANTPLFAYATDWESLDVTRAGGIGTRAKTDANGVTILEVHRSAGSGGGGIPYTITNVNEAFPRFKEQFNGTHEWGEGAAAPDVTLERSAAKTLKVGGSLQISEKLAHLGAAVGFYGKAPVAKPNVATPLMVTAKELCEALESLGLIE